MAQQGNPFYVDPLGGYGDNILEGLSGLGAALGERQELKKQKELLGLAQEIFQRGNPDEIAKFSLQNPQMAQQVNGALKFKSDATRQNMQQGMQRIIAGEDPIQVFGDRIKMVLAQGGDPSDTIEESMTYQQEFADKPDQYRQIVERGYAMAFPQEYSAFRKAAAPADGRTVPFQQGTGPLAGHVFDPETGEYRTAFPEGQMPTKDSRTATQKDFEYIQELRGRGMTQEADALEKKLLKTGDPVAEAAEATFQKENVISTFDRSLDVLDSILSHPALESNVYWRAASRNLPATEAREFEGLMGTLKSQAFLNEIEKMKGLGALSESEGNKVAAAVANLDTLQENGALKNQINIAMTIFKDGKERAQKKYSALEKNAQDKLPSNRGGAQQPRTPPSSPVGNRSYMKYSQ